jgi:chemotaxis protein CheD
MSARYGTFAINPDQPADQKARGGKTWKQGVRGGNVLRGFTMNNIGESNASFVMEYLHNEGVRVTTEDMLGVHPRKSITSPAAAWC